MTVFSLTGYWCFNYSNWSTLFLIHSKYGTHNTNGNTTNVDQRHFWLSCFYEESIKQNWDPSICIIRLMQIEGFGSSRDLALTRVVDLKATVQNMNKLFRSSQRSGTKIYFPQIKVARIKALCVYLRRCLMINQILDVSLITLDKW